MTRRDPHPPDPRFHGRRHGHKLRPRRRALVETLLPHLRIDLSPFAAAPGGLDPADLFDRAKNDIHLEIGFGGGEHLAGQAEANPGTGFLGCEPFVNGVASLLSRIEERNLTNIRIHDDDARDLMAALTDACLARVYLLFPDPWPKRRHAKRRFVNKPNLDMLARLMRPGAELRFATDDGAYAAWTLRLVRAHPAFEWVNGRAADWSRRGADWPGTRYEEKAIRAGRNPVYLKFRRNVRKAGEFSSREA